MKRIFLLFILFALPLFGKEASAVQLVQKTILSYMKEQDIPGASIALYIDGKGYLLHFGLSDKSKNRAVTDETLFEIASITKVFTTTELALEVLRGKMNLSDPITKYFPEIGESPVTLEQLATHTSSYPRNLAPLPNGQIYTQKQIFVLLQSWKPAYPIGTHYLYSNLGVGLLGFSLESVEKMSYENLLKKDIFGPLGMSSTMIYVPKESRQNYAQGYTEKGVPVEQLINSAIPAAGAILSTSNDLLKFLEANLGVKGPQELVRAMKLAQNGYYVVNDTLTMGLGWQRKKINGTMFIDKNGGRAGFSSYIGFIPEEKIGIVILFNKTKQNPTKVGRSLLTLLLKI